MNNKYYIIKKKSLAEAINFLTGQRYYKWDNYNNEEKDVYSFEITDKFMKALNELTRLKKELRDAQDALEILKKAIGILGN